MSFCAYSGVSACWLCLCHHHLWKVKAFLSVFGSHCVCVCCCMLAQEDWLMAWLGLAGAAAVPTGSRTSVCRLVVLETFFKGIVNLKKGTIESFLLNLSQMYLLMDKVAFSGSCILKCANSIVLLCLQWFNCQNLKSGYPFLCLDENWGETFKILRKPPELWN